MGCIDKSCLPPAAARIADVIGIENTIRLMMAYQPIVREGNRGKETSGRYIHIPKKLKVGKISKIIGQDNFKKMIDLYGGDRIYISNGKELLINYKLKCMQELRRAGVSVKMIAFFFNVTERYVYKITKSKIK